MTALVLKGEKDLSLEDMPVNETLGANDVRIQLQACGICGSDLHYFKYGRIGDFIVKDPMILGHEAAGTIVEKGKNVDSLELGDRVCMEPGVPDFFSEAVLAGDYNLDENVRFWATPPIHGVMRESVIHPAALTFKLPGNVSFREGAMIEPLAVGIEAAKKASISPGDIALVIGSGTIGIMTALGALAGGCSKVLISARSDEKLKTAGSYQGVVAINSVKQNLHDEVLIHTQGKGVDILFETSGNPEVFPEIFRHCRRSARAVLIGMMNDPVPIDVPLLQMLGIRIETVFRYRNCFDKALSLVSSGKIDLKRLVSKVFPFDQSIEAYHYAAEGRPDTVKVMIEF